VLRLSDDNFLREIHAFSSTVRGDIQTRSTRLTRSQLGVSQTWDGGAVVAEATSYQDLIDPQEFALNTLPRIAAEQNIPLLNGLAVARFPGEAVDFQRETGSGGLRLDVGPDVMVPFHLNRFLYGSVLGQLRETAYHLTDTEQVARAVPADFVPVWLGFATNKRMSELSTDHTREVAEVQGRIATEMSRVYSFPHFGLDRIRHSIEPEIQYLFVPPISRGYGTTDLPPCSDINHPAKGEVPGRNCSATLFTAPYLFDDTDAINRRNFIS